MVCLYKHLNNETIVDILMVFFVDIFLFILFLVLGFSCFNFPIVEKNKNKVLKFDVMYFPYFEISTALF